MNENAQLLCYLEPIAIIIIIWHYNPFWVFVFSAKSLHVLLSLAASFQFLTFSFFRSSMTSSCPRCLGFPTGLVPIGFQSSSFLVGLAWSILWICPSHLILCTLINLTISAPSIKLSISMLFRIVHILSILTGPNIFRNICLSKMRRLCTRTNRSVKISPWFAHQEVKNSCIGLQGQTSLIVGKPARPVHPRHLVARTKRKDIAVF